MHVDQGTGVSTDVHILQSRSIAKDTYQFTVANTTTGQAQVKLFAVCLPKQTEGSSPHELVAGSRHDLISGSLAPGTHTLAVTGDTGSQPIAPGFIVNSGSATVTGSVQNGTGWQFTLDVTDTAVVELSVRGLQTITDEAGSPAHAHSLQLQSITQVVTAPVGESVQRASCPVGYKGIVAGYSLVNGLSSLGNEPQPINRDFRLLNTSSAPISTTLRLTCLGVRTGTAAAETVTIRNTAIVTTSTHESNEDNNEDSVDVNVNRSAKPHREALLIRSASTDSGLRAASLSVGCSVSSCSGTVAVIAQLPAQTRSTRTQSVVIGHTSYKLRRGQQKKLHVHIAKKYRAALKRNHVKRVTVTNGKQATTVRLRIK